MKPIIKSNFKKVKDDSYATLKINDRFVWSTLEDTIKDVKDSNTYLIELQVLDGYYKSIEVKDLSSIEIHIRSNLSAPYLGLRGKLYNFFVKLFKKKHKLVIKNI